MKTPNMYRETYLNGFHCLCWTFACPANSHAYPDQPDRHAGLKGRYVNGPKWRVAHYLGLLDRFSDDHTADVGFFSKATAARRSKPVFIGIDLKIRIGRAAVSDRSSPSSSSSGKTRKPTVLLISLNMMKAVGNTHRCRRRCRAAVPR